MKHRWEIAIAVAVACVFALPALSWALPSSPWMEDEEQQDAHASDVWTYGQGAVLGSEGDSTPAWSTGAAPATSTAGPVGYTTGVSYTGDMGWVWPGHDQFCRLFPRYCHWRRTLPQEPTTPSVPEPGSMALLLVGSAVAAGLARRRAGMPAAH